MTHERLFINGACGSWPEETNCRNRKHDVTTSCEKATYRRVPEKRYPDISKISFRLINFADLRDTFEGFDYIIHKA